MPQPFCAPGMTSQQLNCRTSTKSTVFPTLPPAIMISSNLLWSHFFFFECFKEPFLAGVVLRSSVIVVEVRCNRSYAVDDLPRFELFQSHPRRDTPRAIVILATQL